MGLYTNSNAPIYGVKWIIINPTSLELENQISNQYEYMTTNTQSLLYKTRGLTIAERLFVLKELNKLTNEELTNIHISVFTECYSSLESSSMYNSTEVISKQWFHVSYENLKNYLSQN